MADDKDALKVDGFLEQLPSAAAIRKRLAQHADERKQLRELLKLAEQREKSEVSAC